MSKLTSSRTRNPVAMDTNLSVPETLIHRGCTPEAPLASHAIGLTHV
ncbi:hypothetical protein JF535_06885 [Microbulbifer salipaludis]|uniref:Uncharacterized protein n=1 Tax=Microbulbifer salipaludis TaxID=187980 RepID=A0ABS3E5J8_9GAMM|nr:hypothetical protein [Microbulbifer salipaludis]MBN8430575.1 hypothetical protein [Microbulbifer salipaludis]